MASFSGNAAATGLCSPKPLPSPGIDRMIAATSDLASAADTPRASRPITDGMKELCASRRMVSGIQNAEETGKSKAGGMIPMTTQGSPLSVTVRPVTAGSAPNLVRHR